MKAKLVGWFLESLQRS